jgi:general secretion pathway protein B
MSFILDALKKSESERQRQAGPALLEMRIVRPARQLPIWALVIGTVLILSVAALAWVVLRPGPAPATAAATTPAPAGTAPAAGAAAATVPAAQNPVATAPAVPVAPLAAPAQVASAEPAAQNSAGADNNPADTEPAVSAPAGRNAESSTAGLRTYNELGGSLPELRLDLHVYAANPTERYAFINMHKVHEGDTTVEGAQVKEITRDGVVLDYRGTEFLLGRQ